MADASQYLTESERVTFNETSRLMQLSDWPAWDDTLAGYLDVTQAWIRERRSYIQGCAEGTVDSGNGPGWDIQHRQERYDYLHKANYSNAKPIAGYVALLPDDGSTDNERLWIQLREMWWMEPKGAYAEQSARRQACTDWLVERRQYVYRCAEGTVETGNGPGWDIQNRRQRYSNLQIATKMGSAYEDWCSSHDPATGQPNGDGGSGSGGSGSKSRRQKALDWMAAHRSMTEQPGGSNCDSRSDGIRTAQDRCAGSGTWLRYQPWCGVWCFNALDEAGVDGLDYNMASVEWIEAQAKAGRKPFTGWTTDPGRVQPGDLVTLFSPGQHVGMVRTPGSNPVTEEGNTSDTSAQRTRSKSDVVGYALVAYPS